MLPFFEIENCKFIPWKNGKEILEILTKMQELTHCAYAIAVAKNKLPRTDILPYENQDTIYIGSAGGGLTADRKDEHKERYKIYTLPHARIKDHLYGFRYPNKVDEQKYSLVIENFNIQNPDKEIFYSIIYPTKECILEEEKKSVARILEYEHINAFIKNQKKPPFMNREFHNTTRREDSLSTKYIKKYNNNNTLLQFMT
jgi:hypothetical protein